MNILNILWRCCAHAVHILTAAGKSGNPGEDDLVASLGQIMHLALPGWQLQAGRSWRHLRRVKGASGAGEFFNRVIRRVAATTQTLSV